MYRLALILMAAASLALAETPYPDPAPSPLAGLDYDQSMFPADADHDPDFPTPDEVLGFPVGQRVATSEQIVEYSRIVAEASDRVELIEYGQTYEGRDLVYLVITSPDNLSRSQQIREGLGKLADPREVSSDERDNLIGELPAVAWMAYSIHGNESSGSDSALAVMYHLAADRSEATPSCSMS
jgi:hypothetical protein